MKRHKCKKETIIYCETKKGKEYVVKVTDIFAIPKNDSIKKVIVGYQSTPID